MQDEALHTLALTSHNEGSSLEVAGLRRHYLLYASPGVSEGTPLLVVLHGSRGDGTQMCCISGCGFDRLTVQEGFLVIYPDGFEGHWNDCRKAANYSVRLCDVGNAAFLRALVVRLAQEYRVDPQRVYAAGYPNGSQMAFRPTAETPGLPAATTTMAASLPTTENDACCPIGRPAATLLISGTCDPINPYLGGKVSPFGFGDRGAIRSTLNSARWWAGLNGIAAPPDVAPLTRPDPVWTERQRWQEGGHPPVELLSVHGDGHVLAQPDYHFPRIFGKSNPELDMPVKIWRFFSQPPH